MQFKIKDFCWSSFVLVSMLTIWQVTRKTLNSFDFENERVWMDSAMDWSSISCVKGLVVDSLINLRKLVRSCFVLNDNEVSWGLKLSCFLVCYCTLLIISKITISAMPCTWLKTLKNHSILSHTNIGNLRVVFMYSIRQ